MRIRDGLIVAHKGLIHAKDWYHCVRHAYTYLSASDYSLATFADGRVDRLELGVRDSGCGDIKRHTFRVFRVVQPPIGVDGLVHRVIIGRACENE